MKRFFLVYLLLFCWSASSIVTAQLKLPALINDHMVLQQETSVPLWGWDKPGQKIQTSGSWSNTSYTAVTGSDGTWKVSVQTPSAGGPYTIEISGSELVTIEDVLLGEVWLCSGQSNMEMPLKGWPNQPVTASEKFISEADYPQMRLFTVPRKIAYQPLEDCSGNWTVTTPESAADFSATAYFFGLRIHQQLDIPVGLIHSSWGGTPAEAWTSGEFMENIEEFSAGKDFDPELYRQKKLKNYQLAQADWLKQLGFTPTQEAPEWTLPDFKADGWGTVAVPASWDDTRTIGQFEGTIRLRFEVSIPNSWRKKETILDLGPIDEMDMTWVNGVLVGSHLDIYDWATPRSYKIPKGTLKKGTNVISVLVANTSGLGGINGQAIDLKIYPEGNQRDGVSLAGSWKFMKEEQFTSLLPMPACNNCSDYQSPTVLYNGMIAPLIPYRIKGAIWYQGESNRYDGKLYGKLFPNMIANWRNDWGIGDFPFYYVQIAPYSYRDDYSTGLLREAQLNTMKVPNTGMVVTMDIGSLTTIHPPDKRNVGLRLAAWALGRDYGFSNLQYSGPVYKAWSKEEDKIRIFFHQTCGGLRSEGGPLKHFMIAGKDMKFVPATAIIEKNTVLVYAEDVPDPVAVRFGWNHTDETNLFNGAGLPASSFRTDTW